MNKCSICKQRFDNTELLQSSQDEYFCKECFKYEYCAGEGKILNKLLNTIPSDIK